VETKIDVRKSIRNKAAASQKKHIGMKNEYLN
jgi:hypothetical protein